MARLWSCGFELQSNGAGIEADTFTGTTSISTAVKRSGAASLRCNPTAGTGFVTHAYRAGSTVRTFFRAYVLFNTLPSADCALLANTDGSVNFPSIWYKASGTCFQAKDGGPTYVGSASGAITTGVWYRLQLDFNDASGDLMNAYVDAAQICTNVNAGDLGGSAQIRFGIITPSVTADAYFDDIAVNDSSGTAQNGLPGAGSIVHLNPNAAGDNNLWPTATGGTAGSANNFTRVSEIIPDDATSFNAIAVTGTTQIDDFNVTDIATAGIGSSDSITLVAVGHRAGSAATTAASIVTRIKGQASGTVVESASLPVNTTAYNTHATAAPKVHKLTAYVNPQGAAAWTPTALNAVQIGYRANVAQTTTRRVTAVWALVEYVPLATTPVSASVDLRWAVRSTVTASTDLRWIVSNTVSKTLDARWAVNGIVSAAMDLRWGVASSVSKALDLRWTSYAQVSATLDARWRVSTIAVAPVDLRWAVAATLTVAADLRYAVRATVSATTDLRWAVTAPVSAPLDLRWIFRNAVAATLDARWAVASTVSGTVDLRWAVASAVSSAVDLRWRVWSAVASALDARWSVLATVSTGMDLRWLVRTSVASSTDLRWISYAGAIGLLDLRWNSDGTSVGVTSTLDARWQVRNLAIGPLDARWAVAGQVITALDARWAVRSAVSASLDARWAVRAVIAAALDARWAVRALISGGLDLRWTQFALASAPLDLRWAAAGGVASVLSLPWNVRSLTGAALDACWAVRGQISVLLDARWRSRLLVISPNLLLWVAEGAAIPVGLPPADVVSRLTHHVTVVDPELVRYRQVPRLIAVISED